MILTVCAVYDSAIKSYGRPFFVPHVGAAIRGFSDEINNSQSDLYKHPDDYSLYELGEWDDANARFPQLLDDPRLVARGKDIHRPLKDS